MNRLSQYLQARQFSEEAARAEGGVWFSDPEIRLAEALQVRGLRFEQQRRLARGEHRSVVLDFLVENCLAVEVDGREFHGGPGDSHRDHDVRIEHGVWTLRVPAWKAFYQPEDVVCLVALKLSEITLAHDGRLDEMGEIYDRFLDGGA